MISIIIPVLNEAAGIVAALQALAPLRARGAEVIVVDGGSDDETRELAQSLADRVLAAPRGRASQMNAGAAIAKRDVFLFLHADTRLPENADTVIEQRLGAGLQRWGRFDVTISGQSPLLAAIARSMNLRSRLSGIATGDQAIFVTREAFRQIGGYPDIPLMEDVALSTALKRISPPLCFRERVVTSGRHWEKRGVLRTIFLMWRLRLAYYFGANPADLARRYGYVPREQ